MRPPETPSFAQVSRRDFLHTTGAAAAAWAVSAAGPTSFGQAPQPAVNSGSGTRNNLPRVASINSVYRFRSHAYHIDGRFLHGYMMQGFPHQPPFQLVRMYNDQYPENDLSRGLAQRLNFQIADNPAAALGGPDRLDVDAVLLIVEHGDYPLNEFGQIQYPRYRLFQEIVRVFEASRRSVPVFNDKHLSYDHRQAAEMVATARRVGFPLMAGSSLPVTWRVPEFDPPRETPFTEALVCHHGGPEVYGFHALEMLQCVLERRRGGETGIKSVRALKGPAVWQAGEAGHWSRELLSAALSRSPSRNLGDPRNNVANPIAILVEYLDGTKGTCLNLEEHVSDMTIAARVQGRSEPMSTLFFLPAPPGARYFDALTWNIEKFFTTGQSPTPIERTLLTSTALDFAMRSMTQDGRVYEDPALRIAYRAPEVDPHMRGRYTEAD